ncbi:hypothetical protein LTS08_004623 [Lithohypha guttulata]|uniref:WW domain-containing protein n=1 Tax=Lithohypha guttulata TaxID=1690604 RepID=A0AAN7T421_9EURO|nr:hypothetical protein LTR05_002539 [Lithohypha guttulata]KAK5101017.1 hypothetical protein LTS08_004623 [Lithohypha guttulata]
MSASLLSPSLPAKPPVSVSDSIDNTSQKIGNGNSHDSVQERDNENQASSVGLSDQSNDDQDETAQPPLPDEAPPPLPNEEPAVPTGDDGWEPVWDENAQAFYFYNRRSHVTQWANPRLPAVETTGTATVKDTGPPGAPTQPANRKKIAGGYDPAIHGDYDPNADYAKKYEPGNLDSEMEQSATVDPAAAYAATGAFNRFTGKWQSAEITAEKFNDENKSKRQMNAFFDVDAAANSHDGRSLKAERSNKKISKEQLKAYRDKRKEKKEEKRRAWLRD